MSAPTGYLSLDQLRGAVADGHVDTVIVAFTDMQGRLVGKRVSASLFLDDVAGEHGDLTRFYRDGYMDLFAQELPNAMSALNTDPSPAAQARADVTYTLIVEGVLAMRPGCQEMADITPAAVAARADEGRRHLHLVKGLIPDVVEALRLRHPRPDSRIDEIEEKQPGDARGRQPCQRLHQCTADIVTDDAGLREAKRIHQRQHVGGLLVGPERPLGLVAVAEAAQIGCIQREAIGEPPHHRLPRQPEFGPAMQQQQRSPGADAGHVKGRAIGLNRQMLHFGLLFASQGRHGFLGPAPCPARHPRLEHGPTAGRGITRHGAWRGGRVVECTALEMRHRCKPIGGSNPSLSASLVIRLRRAKNATS